MKLLNFKRILKTSYSKLMDESYTKGFMVKLQTSDIQMTYEYRWVTYGWHTSSFEWHTDGIRVHKSDIRACTRMSPYVIRMSLVCGFTMNHTKTIPCKDCKVASNEWKQILRKKGVYRYNNADLKILLFVRVHIKRVTWKFRILNPRNSRVIYPWSL